MSGWLLWSLLSMLTGRPLLSLLLLMAFWYGVDRFTWRFLPNPMRWVWKWQRVGRLKRDLMTNPHDRRARLELAELYLERRQYKTAVETLKPNLEAGDDDASTLYTMGVACLGAGYVQQGEKVLSALREEDEGFRLGAVDLELGRFRLKRKDAKGAREALERFVVRRKGSVEGRLLLARALEQGGDDGAGALMRESAWKEYVAAPRFQRNMERFWAWRAKPSRPATYAAVALVLGMLFARYGAPAIHRNLQFYQQSATQEEDD